jgi:hypothetical protein
MSCRQYVGETHNIRRQSIRTFMAREVHVQDARDLAQRKKRNRLGLAADKAPVKTATAGPGGWAGGRGESPDRHIYGERSPSVVRCSRPCRGCTDSREA